VSEVDVRERGGELNVAAAGLLVDAPPRRFAVDELGGERPARGSRETGAIRSLRMRGLGAYGRVPESA